MSERVLEKSKRVFFMGKDDIEEMDHYVLCVCGLCSNEYHVNCGMTPDAADILHAVNSEGWRVYDEFPATNEGETFTVCWDCVKEITGKYPQEAKTLLDKYLNEGIIDYIKSVNEDTFNAARKDYGLADVSKDDEDIDEILFREDMRTCDGGW